MNERMRALPALEKRLNFFRKDVMKMSLKSRKTRAGY